MLASLPPPLKLHSQTLQSKLLDNCMIGNKFLMFAIKYAVSVELCIKKWKEGEENKQTQARILTAHANHNTC